LDYDGTLAGFRREPMDARPSKRIKEILSVLSSDPGNIVTIVSGRNIGSFLELFKGFDLTALNWSGTHGMELRFSGSTGVRSVKPLACISEIKDRVSRMIRSHPYFGLEDKGLAFALHYRRCPEPELTRLDKINSLIDKYRENCPIEVMHMKKVIEVKPAGINKGNTVEAVVSHYGCPRDRLVICAGDDVTDEYLFRANPGGINIKVGDPAGADTCAGYQLKGVSDVCWFLRYISRLR
jgi:trehalose-phosphatase